MTSPLAPARTTTQFPLSPLLSPNPTPSHLPRQGRHTHSPPPTTRNRLLSIVFDSVFTDTVAQSFALPLVANERCGSWYISPSPPVSADLLPVFSASVSSSALGASLRLESSQASCSSQASGPERSEGPSCKVGSAYLKSTDGHHGQWAFSTRRLNLGVLEVVGRYGGCVVVDSTRRGKSMPDALSKTVPIWCAVMNRTLFPERRDAHTLHTPPWVVGESEHAQIEERLDGFVRDFKALQLPLSGLRSKLSNPLRPLWVTQDSGSIFEHPPSFDDFHPVICCTASRRVDPSEATNDVYVQGAGDDSEHWARGLTPALFWDNYEQLLKTEGDEELAAMIDRLVKQTHSRSYVGAATLVKPTKGVHVGTLDNIQTASKENYDCVVACSDMALDGLDESLRKKVLHLKCGMGKLGSRGLRKELFKITEFMTSRMPSQKTRPAILFACPTGQDLAVGIALAALCLFFDGDGNYTGLQQNPAIDKQFIRQRLSWIVASKQDVNPSRATLQSVHAFLMQRRP